MCNGLWFGRPFIRSWLLQANPFLFDDARQLVAVASFPASVPGPEGTLRFFIKFYESVPARRGLSRLPKAPRHAVPHAF